MKTIRKITALTLTIALLAAVFAVSAFTTSAVVEIEDGDYTYVLNSDGFFSVYSYSGSDNELTLPSEALGTKVTAVYSRAFENSNLTSVIIPEGYLEVGEDAFYKSSELAEISFPSTLKTIESSAFRDCSALTSVDLSAAESLKEIPLLVFSGDSALSEIILPDSITKIRGKAFAQTALTSFTMSDKVTELGEGVFENCESIESVTLSENLTEIADEMFSGCKSLSEVNLPEKLESIGAGAFKDCSSLSLTELPTSLKSIGESAFENASSLKKLFISDSVSSIGANAFYPMSVMNTLTVTCYKDSYVSQYCYENFVNYTAVEKKLGDVNLDGTTTILDVALIQKYKIGEYDISTLRAKELADVNKDGAITIRDATLIQMKLARIIEEF